MWAVEGCPPTQRVTKPINKWSGGPAVEPGVVGASFGCTTPTEKQRTIGPFLEKLAAEGRSENLIFINLSRARPLRGLGAHRPTRASRSFTMGNKDHGHSKT